MIAGGKKFEKLNKSKMRKHEDGKDTFKQFRKKHKDKTTYRLLKQERSNDC
jgi:hypothetical protein